MEQWLLTGLGNIGPRYTNNRHNVGFMVVDQFARDNGVLINRKEFKGLTGSVRLADQSIILLKPQTFMNRSGESVQPASAWYRIPADHVIVIHDDIDLPMGRLRVKVGGGHGGHNGLRSIISTLGSPDFARIRMGVGRPSDERDVADFVLADFSREEQKHLDSIVRDAADAALDFIREGATAAMNRYNRANRD